MDSVSVARVLFGLFLHIGVYLHNMSIVGVLLNIIEHP